MHPDKSFPIDIRKPTNLEINYHWTLWVFSLFKDADGRPIGILCKDHDISETKMVNKKLRMSEIN
jgi:hypothetical protein